ncbi:hypothetical protein CR513_44785, partial [Mucuna pruriens]
MNHGGTSDTNEADTAKVRQRNAKDSSVRDKQHQRQAIWAQSGKQLGEQRQPFSKENQLGHHPSPLQGIGDGSFRQNTGPPCSPASILNTSVHKQRKRRYQLQVIPRNLKGSSYSMFVANKAKMLEVADLFDIKQMRGNNAMVQVNNIDQLGKHIEAEEDATDQLEAECGGQTDLEKSNPQGHVERPVRSREWNYRLGGKPTLYNLLKTKKA